MCDFRRRLTSTASRARPSENVLCFAIPHQANAHKASDWKEESLRRYIRSAHSEAAISDAATQLLWRSFHFYAYHPFPQDPAEGELDFGAFKRAVLLTLVQCDDLLGTRELQYFWRKDALFFRKAGVARLFRSIGIPKATTQPIEQQSHIGSIVSDAIDVLVMVVPHFVHACPSPEQLEAVARRLFAEGPVVARREVKRKEVSILISLLLRLRVKKETWGSGGSYFNMGDIVEASSADAELTETLVNSLAGDESKQPIASEQLLKAIELMVSLPSLSGPGRGTFTDVQKPNLQLRFYQLWAVLFQPLVATGDETSSQAHKIPPTNTIGAVLLFAPQLMTEHRYHQVTAQQDKRIERIAVEKAQVYPDSQDISIVRLVQAISRPSSGCIVLFTGDTAAIVSAAAVVGAYFPGPLHIASTKEEEEKCQTGTTTSHLLFQLQPTFRVLRWTKPGVSLMDLIKAEDDTVSLAEIAMREDSEILNLPYRIGELRGQGGGLRIDPGEKTATLASGDGQWYKDVSGKGDDGLGKNWEVTVKNSRMDVFTITGGVDQELQSGKMARVEDLPKHEDERHEIETSRVEAPEDKGPRVEGEALRKRIQGFGSR